jgi:tRNA-specific 2-thiouridylase
MAANRKRVVVAMSGGVDSSVTAALLKDAGYDVVGITLNPWVEVEGRGQVAGPRKRSCSPEDVLDAREVARRLGIPHYVFNVQAEFRRWVLDYYVAEYQRGRTPNPCLPCNRHIRFGLLLNRALALGADYLATGHYARVRRDDAGRYHLLRAVDAQKDQSYVLYHLGQFELGRSLFPLGEYTKGQVRALAAQLGLPVADKPESQDFCFLGGLDYRDWLSLQAVEVQPGPIEDLSGRRLGEHRGIVFYTVGQRRGLGVSAGVPLYVIAIDPVRNAVIVGPEDALYRDALEAEHVSWVSGQAPAGPIRVTARVRYRAPEAPATLEPRPDGSVLVRFDQPQRAPTPGQAVVFYQGDEVLGGGIIRQVAPVPALASAR